MKKEIKTEDVRKLTEELVFNIFEATRFVKMGSGKKHHGVFDIQTGRSKDRLKGR